MIIETNISWGFVEFLKVFFKANDLTVNCEERIIGHVDQIDLVYEDNSDTALSLTFMGVKHLGIENMLCDYLIKCGCDQRLLAFGKASMNRDMRQVEKDWEEKRKELGFR